MCLLEREGCKTLLQPNALLALNRQIIHFEIRSLLYNIPPKEGF